MLTEFTSFITDYENFIIPKVAELSKTNFDATITGKSELFQKSAEIEIEINNFLSDKNRFQKIKTLYESDFNFNEVTKREIKLIYNSFVSHQFDSELMEKIVNISSNLERQFSTFRGKIGKKELTDNQIDEILEKSTNSDELKATWEASKQIGNEVSSQIVELVKLRNQAAKQMGFENYHTMSLLLSEQNPEEMDMFFDELDNLTKHSFQKVKAEIDDFLSKRLNINKNELMPWHYQDKFFQQGPEFTSINFDMIFKKSDIVEITKKYFAEINLPIDDLLANSDLFEKENKYQHAYCTNIDREGDIRVVCNIKPNYKWMSTMLHEFGHAVYDKFISKNLPWELRTHAHIFCTEAIAMLFGRLASNADWLVENLKIEQNLAKTVETEGFSKLRAEQLIFSRWVQVVYRFEREMYKNPNQDLTSLWWNLVEKYQEITKPIGRNSADWASKIHIALYPAYYHNYILGEILASQLHFFITEKVITNGKSKKSFSNDKAIGDYLKNLYFSYGAIYEWNKLIEKATGEKLNPKYYAMQFTY